jgi:hypothetical protein
MLIPATARPGEPYDDLRDAYGRVVTQWRLELGHVVNVVGGVDSRERYVGQEGPRFTPIPRARQAAAVAFLLGHAFETPSFLVDTDLLRRIEPTGIVARLRTAQNSLMNALLQASRLNRLVEQSALSSEAYGPLTFLSDLRVGLWRELATPGQAIDLYRRNVQRVYLDTIDERLNGGAAPADEVRALLRGELRAVDQQVVAALPSVTDTATRRHLQDVRETIAAMLDPRARREPAAGGRGGVTGPTTVAPAGPVLFADQPYDYDHDPFLQPIADCWADVMIR